MNTGSLGRIVPRSARAALQFGLAALGAVVILGSLLWVSILFAQMPGSESGFAEGLALLLAGLYVLSGFVIVAVGLLIPQREDGISFSSRQRTLLTYGAIAPILGVLAIPIGATVLPALSQTLHSILVALLVVLLLSGPLAILLAIGSKARSTVG